MTVRHKKTGLTGFIEWETSREIGIDCGGFTWTGTKEAFYIDWEVLA